MANKLYPAVYGQSLLDICLQVYGSLDLLLRMLLDSGIDNVNVTPASGQVFTYDDTLQTDQAIINKNALSGIVYATDIGNGMTFYTIKQFPPKIISTVPVSPTSPISIAQNMLVYATSFTSTSDGTVDIFPLDKDGLSMAGNIWDIVQMEKEIKPLKASEYIWNKPLGKVSLVGNTLDNNQTLYIIYSKPA